MINKPEIKGQFLGECMIISLIWTKRHLCLYTNLRVGDQRQVSNGVQISKQLCQLKDDNKEDQSQRREGSHATTERTEV